ncbi:MAG TPA: tetratricopeptide repeat protein [Candidatus Polarisedimenticolia bacterium]|nr:tetratricopeptide repeat protein [Candidatus Polarisedimenticolia bacterium]
MSQSAGRGGVRLRVGIPGILVVLLATGLLGVAAAVGQAHRAANAESCTGCLQASGVEACHKIAIELATSREWDRAIAIEEQIHALQPMNAEVSAALAKMYAQGPHNTARAIGLYHEALHAASGYPPALLGLGAVLQEEGEMELAARYFARGAKERPDQPLFKVRLADVLVKSGRETEARPILQEIVQRWPGSSEAASAQRMMSRTELARP